MVSYPVVRTTGKRTALILYRAGSDVAGKLAVFAITVVAARRLSQEGFGVFSLASVLGTFVGLATDFGIPLHVARAVAQRPSAAPEILRRWLRVRIASAGIVTALVVVGVLAWSTPYAVPIVVFALAYVLSALVDFLSYFYRGVGRSDVESSLTIWQRSAMVATCVAALWWTSSVTVLALATLVPVVATLAFSVWFARRLARHTARRGGAVDRAGLPPLSTEFWRDVFPIGAGALLSALYFRVDVFLVERFCGGEAVATYNAAFRLLESLRLVPGAVMAVALPSLCQAADTRPLRQVSIVLTATGMVLMLVGWVSAPWLVPMVYGQRYVAATGPFRILMLSFPLMSLNAVLIQQLIGWHGQNAYAKMCAIALVLNIALNAWLVPGRGIEGAAWATMWTEVLVTAGCAIGLRTRVALLPARPEQIVPAGG
jgi:O-antigen/teichoic acid export membrane protein